MIDYGFVVGDSVEHVKDIGGQKGIVIQIDADHDLGDVTTCNVVWGASTLEEAMASKSDSDVQWTNKLVACDAQTDEQAPPPGYEQAFSRLEQFANEAIDWDGFGGFPADAATHKAVDRYLRYAHQLGLVAPSLTLGNSGAVSLIWKDDVIYAAINLNGDERYSAIILQENMARISIRANAGEYPEEVQQVLAARFLAQA